jgi:hypothetical protein
MGAQPLLDQVSGAARQHVNAAAGLRVDEHGGIDQAPAQREVVDAQNPRRPRHGQGNSQQDPQRGMPGGEDAQCRQQARPGPAC